MTLFDDSVAKPTEGAEDLARAIHAFRSSVDRGDFDGALRRLRETLYGPLLLRRREARKCAELLERLLPEGPDALPPLTPPRVLSFVLGALGLAHQAAGRPGLSLPPLERARTVDEGGEAVNRVLTLRTLAQGLLHCGRLRAAHEALEEASSLAEAARLEGQKRFLLVESWGAAALGGRFDLERLDQALWLCRALGDRRTQGVMQSALAQRRLWISGEAYDEARGISSTELNERLQRFKGDGHSWADQALPHAASALELAKERNVEADFLRAYRLRGVAKLLRGKPGDLEAAAEDLTYVADRVAESGVIEEAIPARVALAELGLRPGRYRAARSWLDEARTLLAGTGYRVLEADFQVVLSRSEQKAGRLSEAKAAATRAYELSWCDGPPDFAYHWGLVAACQQLSALGAAEPRVADPGLADRESRRET